MAGRPFHHPLVELTLARFREFWREPAAVFWTFVFPVALAVGLGIAFRNQPPEPARAALTVEGPASERIAQILDDAEGVELQRLGTEQAATALRKSRVDIVVLSSGTAEAPELRYRFDPMRAESRTARLVVDDTIQRALGREDVARIGPDVATDVGERYIDFLIPGLIGLNIMGSSMWGIGYPVVLARRRRLLKRLAATPMRRSHYMLAFMFSRLFFLITEVVALITFAWLVFDVTVEGSLAALMVVSIIGSLCFTGLALMLASRTDSTEVASGLMNAFTMPMWVLSGAFFAYERFPEFLHPLLRALPLTAFNDAMRLLMNDGGTLVDALPQLGVLIAWGVLAFGLALRLFKWQ